jgi:hypothetical protein
VNFRERKLFSVDFFFSRATRHAPLGWKAGNSLSTKVVRGKDRNTF